MGVFSWDGGGISSKIVINITRINIMRSYRLKENQIGSVVNHFLRYTDLHIPYYFIIRMIIYQDKAGKVQVLWRDSAGQPIEEDDNMQVKGTDLVITRVRWAHMGR